MHIDIIFRWFSFIIYTVNSLYILHCITSTIEISTFLRCLIICLINCFHITILFLFFNGNIMQDIWFCLIIFSGSFIFSHLDYYHQNDFQWSLYFHSIHIGAVHFSYKVFFFIIFCIFCCYGYVWWFIIYRNNCFS